MNINYNFSEKEIEKIISSYVESKFKVIVTGVMIKSDLDDRTQIRMYSATAIATIDDKSSQR